MPAIVETIKLILSDVEDNHNKWWQGELFDDGTVVTTWGRVGYDAQSKSFPSVGESFLRRKEREKQKKGYTPVKTIGGASLSKVVDSSQLYVIAKQQLAKDNSELNNLVKRLVQSNVHNICSQTNITYNTDTGLFQTPLGIVTPDGITEARNLLVAIKKALISKGKLEQLVSSYLRIIPQDVGMRLEVEKIFPDIGAIQKQSDILDSLEASYSSLVSNTQAPNKTIEPPKLEEVFKVDLSVLQEGQEKQRVESWFSGSKRNMHGYGSVKIKQIFTVSISDMDKSFNDSLGNVTEVFHGTSQANVLSILKSGLRTVPPSTAYIAGKMWGNGIYGAINSSKSLGYTFGRWGGRSSASGWLFICDFAMGKIDYPTHSQSKPNRGFDSIWAKASKCGLCHDELIVYCNNQVNIKYLLECN